MNHSDSLARLRAGDPLGSNRELGVDSKTLDALAEGIIMTPRPHPAKQPRRRSLLIGSISLVLIGGGAAYAISNYARYNSGGGQDGITCMTKWHAIDDNSYAQGTYGGAELSIDPISDCAHYATLTGTPAIDDPVAVRWDGVLVVGPADGVPPGATRLEPSAAAGSEAVRAESWQTRCKTRWMVAPVAV